MESEKPSPAQNLQREGINPAFVQSFQGLLECKELMFQLLEMFPIPIEIFDADGFTLFFNKAGRELNNITDASLIIGKYNLLNDPVCNDQLGMREEIQKAFKGETVVVHDVNAPIDDLVKRGVVAEKPFEKSSMDFHLYPVMDSGKLAFVVFVCVVKKLYFGRPDVAKAREYIDSRWKDEYKAKELAKAVSMGVTQLYAIFKEHTGMTPGEYHKKIRVEHIKEKLLDKNLSIKEAFTACGGDSRGRLAKVFKEITGYSPSAWRRNR
jgi:AraC-like DNA-binding protein